MAPPPPPARRGMPWWGVVLIGLGAFVAGAALAAGVIGLIGFAVSDDSALVATTGAGGELALPEAAVGTCLTGTLGDGFDSGVVRAVGGPVPCDERHELELYGATVITLEQDVAYADYGLSWFADGFCSLLFEPYVGAPYEDSQFDYMPVVPSREAWAGGDRRVSCLLYDYEGCSLEFHARRSGR